VSGQVFRFFSDNFSQPVTNFRTVNVIVVNPSRSFPLITPLVLSCIVRWINVDALHLTCVVGKERLERNEIIALYDEIPVARLAAGKVRHVFEQVKRHLVVMIHHRLFPDPVQRRHRENLAKINGRRIPVS
jgi:hypothetical protein